MSGTAAWVTEWIIFENSSHMPHVEETESFILAVDRFLSRVETQA